MNRANYKVYQYEVGDGANTLFWKDKWLAGKNIQDIAPHVYALVSRRTAARRSVLEALINEKWIEDIQGSISPEALMEYLVLWDVISEVDLHVGVQDKHIWRLSTSGQYTARSAYDALFQGGIYFRPYERIWKSWAPPKCHFFMWLVAHNRCWTADRLARRGLQHPDKCLLCDQEDENIQHLLIGCVVARQFWYSLLHSVGLSQLSPAVNDSPFDAWWERVAAAVTGDVQRGLNSLIILGAWCIWKHRNNCVFNGASPSVASMLSMARDEAHLWTLAGAKGLASLSVRVVG